jgi:hypothetical protein
LYAFWEDLLTEHVAHTFGTATVVNLASTEYSRVINRKKLKNPYIDITFKDRNAAGQYVVMSYYAKRARGLMARFILEKQLTNPDELVNFCSEGYQFAANESSPTNLVFLRDH